VAGEREKRQQLQLLLEQTGSALVAFSGGVDSTLLLAVAHHVLGPRCVGFLARSELSPVAESDAAEALATRLGITLRVAVLSPLNDPKVAANPPDRCYHCKKAMLAVAHEVRRELGLSTTIEGSNADDLLQYRPGAKAVCEAGVRSPLAEVGLSKAEIRAWARELGLPNWDAPSSPCLATRFPYGTPLVRKTLEQVECSEAELKALGFRVVRVRHHGFLARIELGESEQPRLLEPAIRDEVVARLARHGFSHVALDLLPYVSGRADAAAGFVPASEEP